MKKPAAVAVEATFNWYYILNVIEPLGLELHLVHPWKTRAIAIEVRINDASRGAELRSEWSNATEGRSATAAACGRDS